MERFIPVTDQLSKLINEQSLILFQSLKKMPVDKIGMPDRCLIYFKGSHFKRLNFSIETSARILYNSIKLSGKSVEDIVLMDYGAGVGTLYSLAKMIGCKKVIYNDFLADWQLSAKLISQAINVEVDKYIVGDIETTLDILEQDKITCDIITSRNVIEHIYDLNYFYNQVHIKQPKAIIYSSTTANRKNPFTYIQHLRMHRKWEKNYLQTRIEIIKTTSPSLPNDLIEQLAKATRGLNEADIKKAIASFSADKSLPDPRSHGSNTCEPYTGVWVEHLLSFDDYRNLISEKKYQIDFSPGFWDTHYSSHLMNYLGRILNVVIGSNNFFGFLLAPFIYVVAVPIDKK